MYNETLALMKTNECENKDNLYVYLKTSRNS